MEGAQIAGGPAYVAENRLSPWVESPAIMFCNNHGESSHSVDKHLRPSWRRYRMGPADHLQVTKEHSVVHCSTLRGSSLSRAVYLPVVTAPAPYSLSLVL